MDFTSFVVLKFGGVCVLSQLSKFKTFESVVEYIIKRFPVLDKNRLKCIYAFQDLKNVMLIDELDFSTMVGMVNKRSKGDIIEISIEDTSLISPIPLIPHVPKTSDMLSNTNQREIVVSNQNDSLVANSLQYPEEHITNNSWSQGIICVRQCFKGGAVDFRDALSKHAIEVGFSFEYVKNKIEKISAQCKHKKDKGCLWRIYAAVNDLNGYMYIKTFVNKHTCGFVNKTHVNKRLSSRIVSRLISDEVRLRPDTTPKEIMKMIKESYDFDITYRIARSGIKKAKNEDPSLSYGQIQALFDAIKFEDPESYYDLEVDPVNYTFERCFFAFGACLQGFNSCCPMLFLDSTSLLGKYKGYLFSAVAKDGNQGLFPVAFAIVQSEDIENWRWFLSCLKPHLLPRKITFISNQNQSIVDSVKSVFPEYYHRFCLSDILNNLRDRLRGRSVKEVQERSVFLLSKCAHAQTVPFYEECFDELIKESDKNVIDFIETLPKEYYANAYFEGRFYGELTLNSNAAHSFNEQIKEFCGLSVTELINRIRVKLMEEFFARSVESLTWTTTLCPESHKRYLQNLEECVTLTFTSLTVSIFEVHCVPIMIVDLERYTCSCGKWDEIGFPCVHAWCVISKSEIEPFQYVENYFHKSKYIECYSKNIPALSSRDEEKVDEIVKRKPGRPKKRVISSQDQVMKKIKCDTSE